MPWMRPSQHESPRIAKETCLLSIERIIYKSERTDEASLFPASGMSLVG